MGLALRAEPPALQDRAVALEQNGAPTSLDPRTNGVGSQGTERPAAALVWGSTLTGRDLRADGVGARGAERLAAALGPSGPRRAARRALELLGEMRR